MKKIIFFISFLCTLHFVPGQSTWFAPQGAKWYYEFSDPWNIYYHYYTEYTATIDTVIEIWNDTGFVVFPSRKIEQTGGDNIDPIEYIVFVDSPKVWVYNQDCDKFNLLFDLGLSTGQSWEYFLYMGSWYCDSATYDVDSTGMINWAGLNLKTQVVSYSNTPSYLYDGKIIERIGPIHSPTLGFNHGALDGPSFYSLRCYEDPVYGLYNTGIAPSCDFVKTGEPTVPEQITFFPNPAREKIYIRGMDPDDKVCEILNAKGTVMNVDWNTMEQSINLIQLKPGFYLIVIRNDQTDGLKILKFIVEQ